MYDLLFDHKFKFIGRVDVGLHKIETDYFTAPLGFK